MRRLLAIAVLGAVALLPLSVQAQRGMGGRGAGGRSMGGRAPAAPARVSPGFSSGRGVAVRTVSPSGRVIVRGGGFPFNRVRPPFGVVGGCFGAFPCRNRFFFHNPFFFGNGFGFGLGFGFPFSYPYYPYIPGFDTQSYAPPPQQPVVSSDNSNNVQLALEMQRLSDQVEFMREEQSRQAAAARASGSSLSAQQPAASTTFVFRDGHRISTQNYAIAGQTLWILSEHMARKIALADLDLAATEQVNAANGVDLHISEPPAH